MDSDTTPRCSTRVTGRSGKRTIKQVRRVTSRLRGYGRFVVATAREAASVESFLRTMQVRLSQSKVGGVVAPEPVDTLVDLRGLGGVVRLRSHTTDISVLGELIVGMSYEPLAREIDSPTGTIVDLGANTGLAARWITHVSRPQKLVCVEPDPGNADVLATNLSHAGLDAAIYRACIGGRARRVRLTTQAGEFAYRMEDATNNTGTVDVLTMDTIIEREDIQRIDVLKCDIEGAEWELFDDCRSWIGLVELAVVECHDGRRASELQEILHRNGVDFDIVNLVVEPNWNTEVVTLRRAA